MMNPSTSRIAVIGSGISGASCAAMLARAGVGVTLFEKARGVGGRFSVRRMADRVSLHSGAAQLPEATPSQLDWAMQLERWRDARLIVRVEGGWRPTQGMNALAKDLLAMGAPRVETETATRVVRIESLSRNGCFRILAEGAGKDSPEVPLGEFGAVVLTAPLPQAIELLDASGMGERLPLGVREVRYTRSVVSFFRFERGVIPEGLERLLHLPEGASLELGAEALVWKSGPRFAEVNWDAADLESRAALEAIEALESLKSRAGFAISEADIVERSFHRWKYARVKNPVSSTFARVEGAGAPLLLAGDAFGASGDAASAYLSGLSAAQELLGRQQNRK